MRSKKGKLMRSRECWEELKTLEEERIISSQYGYKTPLGSKDYLHK